MELTKKLRVLQLGKYYYPYLGGIETHLYTLCEEIKHQLQTEVLVCNSKFKTTKELINNISIIRCLEIFNLASTSICPTMPIELSKRSYDIIHLHFPHPMGVISYLMSAKPNNHKIVISYHSDVIRQEILLKLYSPFMHSIMKKASAIICASPNYINSSQILKKYENKCHVIPYGIDVNQFAMTVEIEKQAVSIRQHYKAPLILGVGRLVYYKGFEYAIRAMQNIEAHLVIIGKGPLKANLQNLAKECGVENRVSFLSEIDDHTLINYYYACDLFVFPSIARSEAFGIVQLEAMACGKAVINTALDSGVPFVSRHKESGLTVEPKNPEALATAINTLLENSSLRNNLGKAGQRRVHAEFSKELMAKRILELYQQI